jgi:hypothetical protein
MDAIAALRDIVDEYGELSDERFGPAYHRAVVVLQQHQ